MSQTTTQSLPHFTDAQISRFQAALDVLNQEYLPMLITLSAQQRRAMSKMGDKNVGFVLKSREYADLNPKLIPGFVDKDAFKIDMEAIEVLRTFRKQLKPLAVATDHTLMIASSGVYQSARMFYENVRAAKRAGVTPEAEAIYEDLSRQFPGAPLKPRRKNEK